MAVSITVGAGGVLQYQYIPARGGDRKFYANKNYLFPIPQEVIDKNSKITSKPGLLAGNCSLILFKIFKEILCLFNKEFLFYYGVCLF